MKRIFLLIAVPIVALIALWLFFLYTPATLPAAGLTFYVKPGTGLNRFAAQLQQQGVIKSDLFLILYGHLNGNTNVKGGEYMFTSGTTPAAIWYQVTNGVGLAYHPFAIIPGWTFMQLKQALAQADMLKHTVQDLSDSSLMQQLGSKISSPEGQFYPETYNYTRGDADLDILKRAYDLMQNHLQQAWAQHNPKLPYHSPYSALIVASLIEKEAFLSNERPIIAGVIVNRLDTSMPLQIDPTVAYALGNKYTGKLFKSDLTINSPYNTYLNHGLPPTPIAIPSQSSLDAAVQPQATNYFYYVARGDGSHQFSENLTQHNAAVAAIMKQDTKQESKNGAGQVH